MATKTFTQLTAVTTLAAGDELVQWNASAGAARKITVANFIANSPNGGLAEKGAGNTFTASQTITSANFVSLTIDQTDSASIQLGAVSGSSAAFLDAKGRGAYAGTGTMRFLVEGAISAYIFSNLHWAFNTTFDDGQITIGLPTARLAFADATGTGSTKSTPGTVNGWVELKIGGVTHYVPAYTSKTS